MKKIMTLSILLILASCNPLPENFTSEMKIPPELVDCTFHKLSRKEDSNFSLMVVRCPNSSTTTQYSSGKTNVHTTVVENSVEGETNVEVLQKQIDVMQDRINGLNKLTPEEKAALGIEKQE